MASDVEMLAARIADMVDDEIPRGIGFAVFLFHSDPRERQLPIVTLTNAEFPQFVNALRELLARHSC